MLRSGDVVAARNQLREALALAITPKVIRDIEAGVMNHFDDYLKQVESAIAQLRADPANATAAQWIRDARRRLARQWLELPVDELELLYDGDLGRLHLLLADARIAAIAVDQADRDLLRELKSANPSPTRARLVQSLHGS